MKWVIHSFLIVCFFLIGGLHIYAQGDRCSSIQPFCAANSQFVFPNSNAQNGDVAVAESGPNYRCLDTQPYPAWFYLQIEDSGNLSFRISQTVNPDGSGGTLDVDFIAWGPFKEGDELCGASVLTASALVDCSYSPSATEEFLINNAQEGQIYVVLINNYSELPGYIRLEQTNLDLPNAGSTDCSIVDILGEDIALCEDIPVKLTATNVNATRYEYFVFDDSSNNFVLLSNQSSPDFTVNSSGLYKVIAYNDATGLEFNDEILIEYFDNPVAVTPEDLRGCSNDSTAIFDLSQVYDEITQDPQNTNFSFLVNFYLNEANFENNKPIVNSTSFEGRAGERIFAAITIEKSGCVSNLVDFNLKISPTPIVDLEAELEFCLDSNGNLSNPRSIGQDLGPGYTYNWNIDNDPDGDGVQNPILELSTAPSVDEIILEIADNSTGCTNSYSSRVIYSSAPENVNVSISGNDFEDGYIISVTAEAPSGTAATYEYQLDDGDWQDQSSFNNVKPGLHMVSVRDIYGCGLTTSAPFRLIGYPRFFTPNADGFNDTWNVVNDSQVSISKVLIYDRYGKLIKQLDPKGKGWDGTYNGKVMPADDYWFVVDSKDQSTGIISEYSGHFSLKL